MFGLVADFLAQLQQGNLPANFLKPAERVAADRG